MNDKLIFKTYLFIYTSKSEWFVRKIFKILFYIIKLFIHRRNINILKWNENLIFKLIIIILIL